MKINDYNGEVLSIDTLKARATGKLDPSKLTVEMSQNTDIVIKYGGNLVYLVCGIDEDNTRYVIEEDFVESIHKNNQELNDLLPLGTILTFELIKLGIDVYDEYTCRPWTEGEIDHGGLVRLSESVVNYYAPEDVRFEGKCIEIQNYKEAKVHTVSVVNELRRLSNALWDLIISLGTERRLFSTLAVISYESRDPETIDFLVTGSKDIVVPMSLDTLLSAVSNLLENLEPKDKLLPLLKVATLLAHFEE